MEGNTASNLDGVQYALRITFGIVHGVVLTLISFALAIIFPPLSHFLFGLFGFVVAPCISFCLTILCTACVQYVSRSNMNLKQILYYSWAPPFGVFMSAMVLLPLEMMPRLGFHGPLNTLAATFVLVSFVLTTLLQIWVARRVQSSSDSDGISSPT